MNAKKEKEENYKITRVTSFSEKGKKSDRMKGSQTFSLEFPSRCKKEKSRRKEAKRILEKGV